MTDLTNEVLEAISDYTEEGFLAEDAVIQANIDACKRQLLIQEECENLGIVMEEDDEIIPKRNGENIFLYIFLFIPRLILNLIGKIQTWIRHLLFPSTKETEEREAREETMKALRRENEVLFNQINSKICDAINDSIKTGNHVGKLRFDEDTNKYVFSWRISKIQKAEQRYINFFEFFVKYEKVFDLIASTAPAPQSIVDYYNEAFNFINTEDHTLSPMPQYDVTAEEFEDEFENFKITIDEGSRRVHDTMNRIMERYREMESVAQHIPNENMIFGKKLVVQIEQAYAAFVTFSTNVITDFNNANFVWKHLPGAIQDYTRQLEKINPEIKEKLKERGALL